MKISETLKEWSEFPQKYIEKSIQVNSLSNLDTINLKIEFAYRGSGIVSVVSFQSSQLDESKLDEILLALETDFYDKVQSYIDLNWYDFTKEPPRLTEIDILVFHPTMDFVNSKTTFYRNFIFIEGQYNGEEIVTSDQSINFQIAIKNMRIINWNYL